MRKKKTKLPRPWVSYLIDSMFSLKKVLIVKIELM